MESEPQVGKPEDAPVPAKTKDFWNFKSKSESLTTYLNLQKWRFQEFQLKAKKWQDAPQAAKRKKILME